MKILKRGQMDKFVEYGLKANSSIGRSFFDRFLWQMVPFNLSLTPKIELFSKDQVIVNLPLKRKNKNHLGGMHACAIATAGEYAAGLWLTANLGFDRYRYILKNLSCEYNYQGRTDLKASCNGPKQTIDSIKQELALNPMLVELDTTLEDRESKKVATVTTTWQLKDWQQVKLN
jgi:acyl-coenzyme A thioesterase PaaI-like protein